MKLDFINYLAIDLLEKCGSQSPTQRQIDLMSALLTKITFIKQANFNHQLSEREVACLFWAAMGKSTKETSDLLALETQVVKRYRQEVKQKLKSKSMAEAIFKGIHFGFLQTGNIKSNRYQK
ncbi:MAG TPA: helix-turn-helix transcriptional regulator [Gammaproteobacteria bacterium]|jgi:DNA-binding CsgD family transcriptional regulator|nr:helix-turn-helix transcriptional regulator [Gammaproteobacteria bacterium]